MKPLKVLIADDEPEARELILHYLRDARENLEVHESCNGPETLYSIQTLEPDILFLDIKMPEMTGIEVLQNKNPGIQLAVIFTTAFDEFALPAFDFEAIDYLVKPFEKERFDRAFRKAIDYTEFIRNKEDVKSLAQVPVKTGSKTIMIPVTDVLYIIAEGSYVRVITLQSNHLISKPIYELEAELDRNFFSRIHRSIIVNVTSITTIKSLLNGDHLVTLNNGVVLKSSRTYKNNIKQLINNQ